MFYDSLCLHLLKVRVRNGGSGCERRVGLSLGAVEMTTDVGFGVR